MRRRVTGARDLTAEQVVAVYVGAQTAAVGASFEARNYAIRRALADHGYTPVDAVRARYWIRRGKPVSYRWDQPLADQGRR